MKTGLPLLATLEEVARAEFIPMEWLRDTAGKFSALLLELLEAEKAVEGQYKFFSFKKNLSNILANICIIETVQILEYPMLSRLKEQDDEEGLVSVLTPHFYEMPWIPTGISTFLN